MIKGYWWDELVYPDGMVVSLGPRRQNTFMNIGRVLAAVLFAAPLKPETLEGVLYHGFGHGDSGWGATPPDPQVTETTLYDEFCRYQPGNVTYVSPAGSVSKESRTSAVKFETTIPAGAHDNKVVREQGLFGGNATATADSGWLINVIRHAPITIPPATALKRYIQLEF